MDAGPPAALSRLLAAFRGWLSRRQRRANERDLARHEDRKLRAKIAEWNRRKGTAGANGDGTMMMLAAGGSSGGSSDGGGGCDGGGGSGCA